MCKTKKGKERFIISPLLWINGLQNVPYIIRACPSNSDTVISSFKMDTGMAEISWIFCKTSALFFVIVSFYSISNIPFLQKACSLLMFIDLWMRCFYSYCRLDRVAILSVRQLLPVSQIYLTCIYIREKESRTPIFGKHRVFIIIMVIFLFLCIYLFIYMYRLPNTVLP